MLVSPVIVHDQVQVETGFAVTLFVPRFQKKPARVAEHLRLEDEDAFAGEEAGRGAANAAGGYVVTERMLGMFKKKEG